jgi:hypothetical protein
MEEEETEESKTRDKEKPRWKGAEAGEVPVTGQRSSEGDEKKVVSVHT